MAVVEEAAVAVDGWVSSFLEDFLDAWLIERSGEFGAFCVLDAMNGPESLGKAVEFNLVENVFPRVVCGKASVVAWVPILCSDDEIESELELVNDGNDFVAIGNSKSAAGQEVVLDINKN